MLVAQRVRWTHHLTRRRYAQMDKEEKLRLIAENGLVKHKRCRNPVLAESTVASSRTSSTATASSDYSSSSRRHGPEVDEDDDDGHGTSRQKSGRPPHHHHRQGESLSGYSEAPI